MKKWTIVLAFMLLIPLAACGGNGEVDVTGTWYSDRPDTLVINDDGTFTSEWLGNGSYDIQNDVITFMPVLDDSKMIEIVKENGKIHLSYEGKYVYLDDQEEVNRKIEEKNLTKKSIVDENIVGEWHVNYRDVDYNLVFNDDGTYQGSFLAIGEGRVGEWEQREGEYEVVEYSGQNDNIQATIQFSDQSGQTLLMDVYIEEAEGKTVLVSVRGSNNNIEYEKQM